MNGFIIYILIGGLASTLSSCFKSKEKFEDGALHLLVESPVKGMDPIYSNDRYSSTEVGRIYEGLLEYDYFQRPYRLKPNLAQALPKVSADGLTYTFKIKKGVKFQDDGAFPGDKGRELVAEDFVYSIKRLANPKLQGLGWWLLDGKLKGMDDWRKKYAELPKVDYEEAIEGMMALDRYTLQFQLTRPFPQFLYALAMPFTFAVAREVVEKYGKEFLNHPVGTGPFKIEDGVFKQSNKIIYFKNPNFREKKFPCKGSPEYRVILEKFCGKHLPLSKKIVVHIITERQTAWLNFQKGKLDFLRIPKDNFDTAIPDSKNLSSEFIEKGMQLTISPALDITYVAFNHDLKLFKNNVALRRAIFLAYNINKSNQLFYNNTALPAQSVIPPGIAGYNKNYRNPYRGVGSSDNLKEAGKLLKEAGYPGGKGLPEITYDCPTSTLARQFGEYFKKQMSQIGIKIRVVQNSWPELQSKITRRQIMLYAIAWGADYPDAENFLQLFYGPNRAPGANGSGYDNPSFNKIFKKSSLMQDSPERTKLYRELNEMVGSLIPLVFGVHRQHYIMENGWLQNYISTDFEVGQDLYLGVDIEKKKTLLKKL